MMNRRATPFFVTGCTVKKTHDYLVAARTSAAPPGAGVARTFHPYTPAPRSIGRSSPLRLPRVHDGDARRPRSRGVRRDARAAPLRVGALSWASSRRARFVRDVRRGARRHAGRAPPPRGYPRGVARVLPSGKPLSRRHPPRVPRRRRFHLLAQTRRRPPRRRRRHAQGGHDVARGVFSLRRPGRLSLRVRRPRQVRRLHRARVRTPRAGRPRRVRVVRGLGADGLRGRAEHEGRGGVGRREGSMLLPAGGGARGHRERASVRDVRPQPTRGLRRLGPQRGRLGGHAREASGLRHHRPPRGRRGRGGRRDADRLRRGARGSRAAALRK